MTKAPSRLSSRVLAAVLLVLCGAAPASADPPPRAQDEPAPLRVEVNLPAFRVDVWSGEGERVASYRACIGAADFPTPVGSFEIYRVVWNPWWVPPASPWAAGKTAMPPGPRNPMGRAKIEFRKLYFLHGTPDTASLGCAASHGCLRLANEDALDLARRVQLAGRPGTTAEELDRLAAETERTRTIDLERRVPLEVAYRVAEVEGEELLLHADIYGRLGRGPDALERAIVEALVRAGHGEDAINLSFVAISVRALPKRGEPPLRIPLDVLVLE